MRTHMAMRKTLITVFFILACAVPVFAQPPVPPGSEPGAEAERFQKQTESEKKRFEQKKKVAKIQVQEKEEKPAAEGISFILKEVKITDATLFKPEDFKPIYQPYLDKTVTFKDLQGITSKIEAKYKEKGYLTTAAYLPKQEIKDGVVQIAIAEGKMGELKIEGNKWFSASFIERYFHIKKNELLNLFKLQKDLLRLAQNQDLTIEPTVTAGKEKNTSDVILKVKDIFPWHAGVSVDDQGTRLTGKYRTSIYVRSSNVTGYGDSLFESTLLAANSVGQSASYDLPLGTHGTKLGFDFTYFHMKLGKEYSSYKITGDSFLYTPHLQQEIVLRENLSASVNAGLMIKSIKKYMASSTTSKDELRLPYFGGDLTSTDSFLGGGQNSFSPKFVFGTTGFLGASTTGNPKAGRPGTDTGFFKYEQFLSRYQKMPLESYMQIRSQFQAASHSLPSSEQLQLGGANSVRGYPEGDYLADLGATLNLDWIFPMYLFPRSWKLPKSPVSLRNQIEPCLFMDLGGGKLKKVLPGENKDKFLMGMGGGFRVHLQNKIFLKLEWAQAVGDKPVAGAGPSTFHLTFQAEM